MIPALRESLAAAMWEANRDLGLRVDIVRMIQLVLNELFRIENGFNESRPT